MDLRELLTFMIFFLLLGTSFQTGIFAMQEGDEDFFTEGIEAEDPPDYIFLVHDSGDSVTLRDGRCLNKIYR